MFDTIYGILQVYRCKNMILNQKKFTLPNIGLASL